MSLAMASRLPKNVAYWFCCASFRNFESSSLPQPGGGALVRTRASTLESPANGSRRMQSGRSERQHRLASQLPHECRSAGRTMDATDTAAPEIRYCRPHASLGYKPPAPEVFAPDGSHEGAGEA